MVIAVDQLGNLCDKNGIAMLVVHTLLGSAFLFVITEQAIAMAQHDNQIAAGNLN
ncbi:hypothetical protein [Nitrosomonas marina]|uniref:Uncharacterized protein n=1 Tax=Nitrosomonas marina TaxID=917 RepID=A0A1H8IB61_9PROT|nr:hypothetical protein [Nitrosomonas marina]SEN66013.1 hypothetical protein SAMN05216325_1319 [Nitrosomonas marina]